MDDIRVADRAVKSTRETGPSAALSRVAHTGSMAPPTPPGIRTGLTRVFPGACGATRSAPHSRRRGCARKRMMLDVGERPRRLRSGPNACRDGCASEGDAARNLRSLSGLLLFRPPRAQLSQFEERQSVILKRAVERAVSESGTPEIRKNAHLIPDFRLSR
jgi:hypothetical protein